MSSSPTPPPRPLRDGTAPSAPEVREASRRPRPRTRGVLGVIALCLLAALLVATVAFLAWSRDTYTADPEGIASAQADSRIHLDDRGDLVVLGPAGEGNGRGLIFLPGAKVEPESYVATLRELAAGGTTVVLVRPFLNLALLERRPFEAYTAVAPEVDIWAVGGHSMGGVRACTYAESEEVSALVLLASYCSGVDLSSRTDLAALSVLGSEDGLIAAESLRESREIMPPGAESVRIDGATHAQFGDYGPQDGDGTPAILDGEARQRITAALVPFLGSVSR